MCVMINKSENPKNSVMRNQCAHVCLVVHLLSILTAVAHTTTYFKVDLHTSTTAGSRRPQPLSWQKS